MTAHAPIAVTIAEASTLVPASTDTIRRAIRKDRADDKFPPPLAAKRDGKGRLSISVADLTAWHEAWEDA
jgi:hypothetical protein